jgi:mycothiol synthase
VHDLPPGVSVRGVTVADAALITELVNETTMAEVGMPWVTEADTRTDLTGPGRDPPTEDALVLDADQRPAGYLALYADEAPFTEIFALVYVPPRAEGRGIGTYLLALAEERARSLERVPRDRRAVLRAARFTTNGGAKELLRDVGYMLVRTFWLMEIDLDEGLGTDVPAGIAIRPFDPARDAEPLYRAMSEAFQDHWGGGRESFEQWRHHLIDVDDFDPTLWFVALDGEEVVGGACCRSASPRDATAGVVRELAVRARWRRRGIGRGLLLAAFEEMRRRGVARAQLSVDAANPTGATRLYEGAGMHVRCSWEVWEKALRDDGQRR